MHSFAYMLPSRITLRGLMELSFSSSTFVPRSGMVIPDGPHRGMKRLHQDARGQEMLRLADINRHRQHRRRGKTGRRTRRPGARGQIRGRARKIRAPGAGGRRHLQRAVDLVPQSRSNLGEPILTSKNSTKI